MNSFSQSPIPRRAIALLPVLLIVAACSSDSLSPKGARSLSLSFSTAPRSSASPSTAPATSVSATDAIVLTKVQLVLSDIELAKGGAGCTESEQGQQGECDGLELAPVLIDLPVTAGVTTALTTTVPQGTYSGLDAAIKPLRSDDASSTALLTANPSFAGKSLRVEGTYGGVPFTFFSDVSSELQLTFVPPLVVSTDKPNLNVTVAVDLQSWFLAPDGITRLNPADPTNAATIAANIRRSFRAFEDDNEDGREDSQSSGE